MIFRIIPYIYMSCHHAVIENSKLGFGACWRTLKVRQELSGRRAHTHPHACANNILHVFCMYQGISSSTLLARLLVEGCRTLSQVEPLVTCRVGS